MIERPKRAVTRFFIPLIDVMILLFCIFLLMPFMSQPGSADQGDKNAAAKQQSDLEDLKNLNAGLRIDLERAKRDVKQLQEERVNPAGRVSVRIMEIDPTNNMLFTYSGGKRKTIDGLRTAQDVIDEQQRIARLEGKEPLFLILLPTGEKGTSIGYDKLQEFKRWFAGVPFNFENPLNIEVP